MTVALQLEDRANGLIEFRVVSLGAHAAQTISVLVGRGWKTESYGNVEHDVRVFNESLDGSIFTEQRIKVGERINAQPDPLGVAQLCLLLSLDPAVASHTFTNLTVPVIKGNAEHIQPSVSQPF